MYERFTDRARKVMQLANQEAQRLNHEYIGTEHILLGLVKEGAGVAANVLKNLGIDLRKIRLEVEKLVQSSPEVGTPGKLPQTPRAKKVIEYSIEEARNLSHNYVGTEHLLLGLLREQEGIAGQVLLALGVTLEGAREEIKSLLNTGLGDTVTPHGQHLEVKGVVALRERFTAHSKVWCPVMQGIPPTGKPVKSWRQHLGVAVQPDGMTRCESRGQVTFDGEVILATARPFVEACFPIFPGYVRESSTWSVSVDGKSLSYEIIDVEQPPVKPQPLANLQATIDLLRQEMETAKKAGKLDTACALLRVLKQLEAKPQSWLNEIVPREII